jgi:ABC-type Zn uptake system ZnuABC Zn-binding protein ZnuA
MNIKKFKWLTLCAGCLLLWSILPGSGPIKVITTFSDYASIVKELGGEKVSVEFLSHGDQDPHFVPPKPSLSIKLRKADMFVCTGLDLEVWATTLLDKARNRQIMDGAQGYVTVYEGIELMQKPQTALSRTEGDIHIYGNPHIHTSPLNWKYVSRNILIGLKKVDPNNASYYESRQKEFEDKVDRAMFGENLVEIFGGETLWNLLQAGNLFEFLEKEYQGSKLIELLGGWLKKALPFRDKEVIAYHKNWAYFARDFGLKVIGYIETKPGIPPTPKHIEKTIQLIESRGVDLMVVATYFEKRKPRVISQKTGIKALFLPLSVGGNERVVDNFQLMDYWIEQINEAVL